MDAAEFQAALVGQPLLHAAFEHQIATESVPQAQLLVGPEGLGKCAMARAFGARLLGVHPSISHPDLHVAEPEGRHGMYTQATLRSIQEQAHLSPQQGRWKLFLLDRAHQMAPAGANALLKLLEEPPPHTLFFLIAPSEHLLLPTLVSRCRLHRLLPLSEEQLLEVARMAGAHPSLARTLLPRAHGSPSRLQGLLRHAEHPLFRTVSSLLPRVHQISAGSLLSSLQPLDPERSASQSLQELELYREVFELCCQMIEDWARDLDLVDLHLDNTLTFPEQRAVLEEQAVLLAPCSAFIARHTQQARVAVSRFARPSLILSALLLRFRSPQLQAVL